MLTACTSEDDIMQTGQQTVAASQEVGFEIYTPAATETRAGLTGTMTTNRLQRTEAQGGGFGVYAFQTLDSDTDPGDDKGGKYASGDGSSAKVPDFMINEKLLWNATNQGWYYNPLKYWPNETDNDSQNTSAEMEAIGGNKHLDRLTFFAYAPYVTTGSGSTGITAITDNAGMLGSDKTTDPTIRYVAALDDPNAAVDLLWGVAPAGGLTYTAVNGRTVKVDEGMPLIDMTKPDVNTNMKFLFQHALARIGVTAVAAVDQMGAGGVLDPNTKITIEKITLTGFFGETGDLNLNNKSRGAGVANWIKISDKAIADITISDPYNSSTDLAKTTLTLQANQASPEDGSIATHLQFVGTPASNPYDVSNAPVEQLNRVGVTTVRQNVIQPAKITAATPWVSFKNYAANKLEYSETTPYYYNDATCATPASATIVATSSDPVYTVNSLGVYTEYTSNQSLQYPQVNKYYTLHFVKITSANIASVPAGKQMYRKNGSDYEPEVVGKPKAEDLYYIDGEGVGTIKKAEAFFADAGNYYKRDANYFMVIPTNNISISKPTLDEALRTVRVMIEYYVTTEDKNVDGNYVQTKNVIEKDVLFPSLANGKSYNLNLVLGLTSVKMEAEVDDWKVVNVQGDLPQNTAE